MKRAPVPPGVGLFCCGADLGTVGAWQPPQLLTMIRCWQYRTHPAPCCDNSKFLQKHPNVPQGAKASRLRITGLKTCPCNAQTCFEMEKILLKSNDPCHTTVALEFWAQLHSLHSVMSAARKGLSRAAAIWPPLWFSPPQWPKVLLKTTHAWTPHTNRVPISKFTQLIWF